MSQLQNMYSEVSTRPVIVVVLSLVAAMLLYFLTRLVQERRFYNNLPRPPHSFLFGHITLMASIAAEFPPNMHPMAYYTTIARRYNLDGIWYLDLWPIGPSGVILTDPELLEKVTTVKPLDQHQVAADFLDPMLGKGVIAVVNGSLWKGLHRAMAPAFSWSHIKSLTALITDECMLFRDTLNLYASTSKTFSMEHAAMKLVFDVIGRVIFNTSLNAQTQGSQYLDDLREMISLAEELFDPLTAMNPMARVRIYFRRRQVLSRLHPSIISKIQERLSLLLKEGTIPSRREPNSILDLMLREKLETQQGSTDLKSDMLLSSEELEIYRNNIKGLLAGGHGTTTDSLCYTYMLLSTAPEVMAKLRQECTEVYGTKLEEIRNGLVKEPDKLQTMPYLEAVLKETLRLFPVGFGVRAAKIGDTLTYKGRTFPIDRNLAVTLQAHDVHYNSELFPEPAKFVPERWLDPDHPIPRSYFRTFGRGLRACQGQNLAMNELKIILLMTMQDYDLECVNLKPNDKPRAVYTDLDMVYGDIIFQELGIEAKPRGGMMMRVRKR